MARGYRDRLKAAAVLALGLILLFTVGAYAEDPPFSGKWKGESRVAAPGGAGGPGAPGGAPGAGAATAAPVGAPAGGAAPGGGAPGGGAPGGGGAPRAGGGAGRGGAGGSGAPQKMTLNLKQGKDNKISGNMTIGEGETQDVKDGKADGNTITFKVGRAPQPIYEYKGELQGNELILTRQAGAAPAGGGGAPGASGGRGGFGGGPASFVLTKK